MGGGVKIEDSSSHCHIVRRMADVMLTASHDGGESGTQKYRTPIIVLGKSIDKDLIPSGYI